MPKAAYSQHVVTGHNRRNIGILRQQTLASELAFLDRKGLTEDGGGRNSVLSQGFASAPEAAIAVVTRRHILRAADMSNLPVPALGEMMNRQFHCLRVVDPDARNEFAFRIAEHRDDRNVRLDAGCDAGIVSLEGRDDQPLDALLDETIDQRSLPERMVVGIADDGDVSISANRSSIARTMGDGRGHQGSKQ